MECLVRVVDRSARADDAKRGDLICAQPDGWAWSQAELTNPAWRIIRVNVLRSTVDALLSRVERTDGKFRRRDWALDFSKSPTPSDFDYTGSRPRAIIIMTRAQVALMVTQKLEM